MRDILVLCPTRNRPEQAAAMLDTFHDTATRNTTRLVFVVDRGDPRFMDYVALQARYRARFGWDPDRPTVMGVTGGTLVAATNDAASRFWGRDLILGHVGDDHRFRTTGWDRAIAEALTTPGVAYGDDGAWGEVIATAPFVSSEIPRTLGWLALPTCSHNGWDNAVMDLGRGIGALHYLPDVHISHPPAEKRRRSRDPGYRRARGFQDADKAALQAWREGARAADIARLRAVLEVAA